MKWRPFARRIGLFSPNSGDLVDDEEEDSLATYRQEMAVYRHTIRQSSPTFAKSIGVDSRDSRMLFIQPIRKKHPTVSPSVADVR